MEGRQEIVSPETVLPEDDLAFFLLDAIPQFDLSAFYAYYSTDGRGQPPFSVEMMVTLLVYSYSVGVFSSRKIAAACERNLAFLAIVGGQRPDFRTISEFRKLLLQRAGRSGQREPDHPRRRNDRRRERQATSRTPGADAVANLAAAGIALYQSGTFLQLRRRRRGQLGRGRHRAAAGRAGPAAADPQHRRPRVLQRRERAGRHRGGTRSVLRRAPGQTSRAPGRSARRRFERFRQRRQDAAQLRRHHEREPESRHGEEAPHADRPRPVCGAETHRGTRVRPDQADPRLPQVPASRPGTRVRGVATDLPDPQNSAPGGGAVSAARRLVASSWRFHKASSSLAFSRRS